MAFVNLGKEIVVPLIIGSIVVGAVCAVIAYWLALRILFYLNRKRRANHPFALMTPPIYLVRLT